MCNDKNFLIRDVSYHHEDFGKVVACDAPVHDPEKMERYEKLTNMNRVDFGHKFGNIKPCSGNANVLKACAKFMETPWDIGWLYIWGVYGNGKTTMLKSIVNAFAFGDSREHGLNGRYIDFGMFLAELKDTYSDVSDKLRSDVFNKAANSPLLVIDELDKGARSGKGELSPHDKDILYILMNTRYEMYGRQKGVTVFCSNKHPKSFLPRPELSRLSHNGFMVVENRGLDARPNAKVPWQDTNTG